MDHRRSRRDLKDELLPCLAVLAQPFGQLRLVQALTRRDVVAHGRRFHLGFSDTHLH
jgi:hypothetical protein